MTNTIEIKLFGEFAKVITPLPEDALSKAIGDCEVVWAYTSHTQYAKNNWAMWIKIDNCDTTYDFICVRGYKQYITHIDTLHEQQIALLPTFVVEQHERDMDAGMAHDRWLDNNRQGNEANYRLPAHYFRAMAVYMCEGVAE